MNQQLSENLDPKADSEELVATIEELDFSHKKRIIAGQGKEVPMDLFLYSCLEEERLIRASPISQDYRWPELPEIPVPSQAQKTALKLADEESAPAESGSESTQGDLAAQAKIAQLKKTPLTESIKSLVSWYRTHHPVLASNQPLDHTQLNEVRHPLVAMVRDIEDLYLINNPSGVPQLGEISAAFPTYAHLIKRYLEWSHGEDTKEEFVRGSRPPVGRYAPPPLPRSKSGGNFDRTPTGKPPRREDRDNDRSPSGKGSNSKTTSATERQPRSKSDQSGRDRNRNGPRGGSRPKNRGPGQRDAQSQDDQSAKLEKIAMDAVEQGIETLKSHPELSEVVLEATNSFYRRLQHQRIEERGYSSDSLGEGSSRSVVLKKEN